LTQTLLCALVGYCIAWVAWIAARHLVARYRADDDADALLRSPFSLRNAQGKLSLLAELTQVGLTLAGGFIGWRASNLAQIAPAFLVTGILAIIALVDLQVRRIPNVLVVALLVWALAQILWLGRPTAVAAAEGMLLAGAIFLFIALIGRGAMGAGDIKLEAALGALLGFPLILRGLFWGIVAGGVAALVLMLTRRVGRKEAIAYGPYLALGGWVILMASWGLGL
jgi:leader peptidase (prepilin peptidase) / N-methyltransferase